MADHSQEDMYYLVCQKTFHRRFNFLYVHNFMFSNFHFFLFGRGLGGGRQPAVNYPKSGALKIDRKIKFHAKLTISLHAGPPVRFDSSAQLLSSSFLLSYEAPWFSAVFHMPVSQPVHNNTILLSVATMIFLCTSEDIKYT